MLTWILVNVPPYSGAVTISPVEGSLTIFFSAASVGPIERTNIPRMRAVRVALKVDLLFIFFMIISFPNTIDFMIISFPNTIELNRDFERDFVPLPLLLLIFFMIISFPNTIELNRDFVRDFVPLPWLLLFLAASIIFPFL